jgi:glucoamylase
MDKGIEKHDVTRPPTPRRAKGKPGQKPMWSSGAKTLAGTAASSRSRIWFTIGNGTINELYFPDVDQANTRSVRFLVTDGKNFFSDEQWDADHSVTWLAPGVPGCHIQSKCKAGRYTIIKDIVTDPLRDTLMMRVRFIAHKNKPPLKLFLFEEPQMGDRGEDNTAWIGQYKGLSMMFAQREHTSLATAFDPPALQMTCGYVGTSDGCKALSSFKGLPDANMAAQGNIALTAEIDTARNHGKFLVSLACGSNPAEAAQQARAGTLVDFDTTQALFLQHWQERQATYFEIKDLSSSKLDMYRVSTAVLETHQSKRFPGAFIASLSFPWGFDRSDADIGGYHVLWPRDMCETAMGKLASGDARSARSALFYLSCTQNQDGGWSQNMWLDGTQHWGAIQMDSMALPILLAAKIRQQKALEGCDPGPMVHGAACFLLQHGPVSQQGRWESTPGYSVYTLATEIAALLAAADFAEDAGHHSGASFLRETADAWYDSIDELTYAADTPLSRKHGVSGYYMRVTPPTIIEHESVGHLRIKMPNHPAGSRTARAIDIVSPDALALVRFGLRKADDPRILDTIKIIDATLKRDTATGPGWTRSTDDGYGEKKDGRPFDKSGIGRVWPLLAGERAHYEIAAGNHQAALELLRTMARQTSEAGMIPEQIWDGKDIPKRFLFNGHPAGSGMPLVWAHSEYIKLLRSLHQNAIWDLPPQTVERYLKRATTADFQIWTTKQRRVWLAPGKDLRVDLDGPADVTWTTGKGKRTLTTRSTGFQLQSVMLPLAHSPSGSEIKITIAPQEGTRKLKPDSFTLRVRSCPPHSAPLHLVVTGAWQRLALNNR